MVSINETFIQHEYWAYDFSLSSTTYFEANNMMVG